MRALHLPVWFGSVQGKRAVTFASLFAIFTCHRGLLVTVIPLSANEVLGSAQQVSLLYFVASFFGILGTFASPWGVHILRRRWVFTLGTLLSIVGAMVLSQADGLPLLLVGMAAFILAVAMIDVTFNLYLLDHIPRDELGGFEPVRMFAMAVPWSITPWLGVTLRANLADWAPFALASLFAGLLLAFFWYLRLTDDPAVAPLKKRPPSPLKNIVRFFRQPRLLLAWVLSVGRASWWVMFFVYGPIYAVNSGLSEEAAGIIASVGAGTLYAVPLWSWVGRRLGLRQLLTLGYLASAAFTCLLLLDVGLPLVTAALLIASALATGIIDAAGNLPFLRAVHHYERAEMTSVFATYRDIAQLVPPGVFAVLLTFLPLTAVFIVVAGMMTALARYTRYLPKRL